MSALLLATVPWKGHASKKVADLANVGEILAGMRDKDPCGLVISLLHGSSSLLLIKLANIPRRLHSGDEGDVRGMNRPHKRTPALFTESME